MFFAELLNKVNDILGFHILIYAFKGLPYYCINYHPSLIKEWGVVVRFAILVLIFFYRLLQGIVGYLAEFLVISTNLCLYTLTDEFVSEINEMMVHTYSCSLKEVLFY